MPIDEKQTVVLIHGGKPEKPVKVTIVDTDIRPSIVLWFKSPSPRSALQGMTPAAVGGVTVAEIKAVAKRAEHYERYARAELEFNDRAEIVRTARATRLRGRGREGDEWHEELLQTFAALKETQQPHTLKVLSQLVHKSESQISRVLKAFRESGDSRAS